MPWLNSRGFFIYSVKNSIFGTLLIIRMLYAFSFSRFCGFVNDVSSLYTFVSNNLKFKKYEVIFHFMDYNLDITRGSKAY
jgi:hypothetical protein